MRYLIVIIFLSFCLVSSCSWAGSYSLNQLDADLVSFNPKLKALQLNYLALHSNIKSAASFNDLTAGVEWRGPQRTLFLSQQIPFLGKLNDLEKVAHFESQEAYFEYADYQNQIRQEIMKLIYRQKILKEKSKIYSEELKTYDQTLAGLSARLAGGKGGMADLYALKLAKTNLRKQIIDLKQQQTEVVQSLIEKLSINTNDTIESPLPALKSLKVNEEQLLKNLFDKNYMLRQKQMAIQKRFWQLELARKGYFPDFNVKVGSMETPGMNNELMGEFSINIPWFNARHDGQVGWIQSLGEMNESELQALQRALKAKTHILISQWQSILQKNTLVIDETLKFTKLRYESIKNLYQTDQADLIDLTESRREFLQAKLEALDLQDQGLSIYLDLMTLIPTKEAL
jgi:outer membrane protein TolC